MRSVKVVAVVALVAAAVAAVVIPTVRKHRVESAANERRALDIEIGMYYEKTAKPLLAAEFGEPQHVIGRLLPVVIKNSVQIGNSDAYTGTALDTTLYTELDAVTRIDRLAGAGTLVFVVSDATTIYSGGETGIATVASGLTITLFDPATKAVLGRKHFDAPEPPKETNREGLEYYAARQAAQVAAYLKSLPRR